MCYWPRQDSRKGQSPATNHERRRWATGNGQLQTGGRGNVQLLCGCGATVFQTQQIPCYSRYPRPDLKFEKVGITRRPRRTDNTTFSKNTLNETIQHCKSSGPSLLFLLHACREIELLGNRIGECGRTRRTPNVIGRRFRVGVGQQSCPYCTILAQSQHTVVAWSMVRPGDQGCVGWLACPGCRSFWA